MRASILIRVIVIGLLTLSCGKHVPEPPNVAPGVPHVTWVLMYGDRDNADQEFACQSDSQADCTLPASRPDAEVFSDVHIYYHGAGEETRYEGTVTTGYLRGSPETHAQKTSVAVRKIESIMNHSVLGIVSSTPGMYSLAFSLKATVTDSGRTNTINDTTRIAVK